jgi:hypothetical protein
VKDRVRQLARLAEIQRLRKFGHETRLAAIEAQIASLVDECRSLLDLQDRHYEGGRSFIPLETIVRRVEAVLRQKDVLEGELVLARRTLLEASRILDKVDEKHIAERRTLDRAEGAKSLEEALAHLIARNGSSLP